MQDFERQRVAEWVTSMKGDRTGEDFADDVTATTGWKVDRSRLSKYGKADSRIDIGSTVIGHLSRYAEAKGLSPLDLKSAEPPLSLEERAVRAAERQADMLRDILEVLQGMTEATKAQPDLVRAVASGVAEGLRRARIPVPEDPEQPAQSTARPPRGGAR